MPSSKLVPLIEEIARKFYKKNLAQNAGSELELYPKELKEVWLSAVTYIAARAFYC